MASVELMISRLEGHLGVNTHKVRGPKKHGGTLSTMHNCYASRRFSRITAEKGGENQIHIPNWVVKRKIFHEGRGFRFETSIIFVNVKTSTLLIITSGVVPKFSASFSKFA